VLTIGFAPVVMPELTKDITTKLLQVPAQLKTQEILVALPIR
jgi:hypothetical protein